MLKLLRFVSGMFERLIESKISPFIKAIVFIGLMAVCMSAIFGPWYLIHNGVATFAKSFMNVDSRVTALLQAGTEFGIVLLIVMVIIFEDLEEEGKKSEKT